MAQAQLLAEATVAFLMLYRTAHLLIVKTHNEAQDDFLFGESIEELAETVGGAWGGIMVEAKPKISKMAEWFKMANGGE